MGISIARHDPNAERRLFTLKERTYVNQDKSKVVPENSPEAFYLLGNTGWTINYAEAERLGLVQESASESESAPETEVPTQDDAAKSQDGPEETKAIKSPKSKKAAADKAAE